MEDLLSWAVYDKALSVFCLNLLQPKSDVPHDLLSSLIDESEMWNYYPLFFSRIDQNICNSCLLTIFGSTIPGSHVGSSQELLLIKSRHTALEENFLQSENQVKVLQKLCTTMKSESNWKDSSHDAYKRKMKDFKDNSNDCIWELQDQLRNINSILFLERQRNQELESSLILITQKLKDTEEKNYHSQSPSLKRNNDLRFAQSRIFGTESQIQHSRLQGLDRSKKKPQPRGVAKTFLKENNDSHYNGVIVIKKENIYDELAIISDDYPPHDGDFCI